MNFKTLALATVAAVGLSFSLPIRASAEVTVVADVVPVGMLVTRVLDGAGETHVLLPPGGTPHDYRMKPSDARALQSAALVVWVGEALTPWLEDPIRTLAADAGHLELLDLAATVRLVTNRGADFSVVRESDDDSGRGQDDHGGVDPHAWLHPANARIWTSEIAAELGRLDPDNADLYAANAEAARAEITAAEQDVRAMLAPVAGAPMLALHDAFAYLEDAFGLNVVGAVAASDDTKPGARRISEVRALIARTKPMCLLAEPGGNSDIVAPLVPAGGSLRTGRMDLLGADLNDPKATYPDLLRALGAAVRTCVDGT